jgi:putative flippase GtrA
VRAVKFYAVGLVGIGVQLGALGLLHGQLGVKVTPATIIAVEIAVLHNFLWHDLWTWRDRRAPTNERLQRLLRFHLTNGLISIGGNLAITNLLIYVLGVHYLLANAAAITLCALANFAASEKLVFRSIQQ